MKKFHFPRTRLIAALLALVCVLGLLPSTAFAATQDITFEEKARKKGGSVVK